MPPVPPGRRGARRSCILGTAVDDRGVAPRLAKRWGLVYLRPPTPCCR